jgi:cell division protein FtsL
MVTTLAIILFSSVWSRVVREQYCLCSPKTRLEKVLIIVVVTLVLIIILLVVAVGVLAGTKKGDLARVVHALTPKI